MNQTCLASIIINNYNYACFLKDAINSALKQTYSNLEVIVVDDGSTDNSREIIASYGRQIIPILKENAGQTSALNAGFAASKGEIIIFLDSDDMLLPTAMKKAVEIFLSSDIVKVHWYQWAVNEKGRKTDRKMPDRFLGEGNFREETIAKGMVGSACAPTSGNAWLRKFLEIVYPLHNFSSKYAQNSVDVYLCRLATILGNIKRLDEPQGYYRVHQKNLFGNRSLAFKIQHNLIVFDCHCLVLAEYLQQQGVYANPETWKKTDTPYGRMKVRLELLQDIEANIAENETFIWIDDQLFNRKKLNEYFFPNQVVIPFLEQDSQYWGPSADSQAAIEEIEKLRLAGANFIVFLWPSFWWLEYYQELAQYLHNRYHCLLENERCIIFDIHFQPRVW
jgi:glycosyltransferase involved in cell wall biosynthesis